MKKSADNRVSIFLRVIRCKPFLPRFTVARKEVFRYSCWKGYFSYAGF